MGGRLKQFALQISVVACCLNAVCSVVGTLDLVSVRVESVI